MPDLQAAQENGGTGSYTGRWDGQKIMAITVLSSFSGEELLGLRYVVSMQAIDRQLTLITVFAALVALAILLFVLYTSSYFMNSIIAPVGEVSRTARQIAQGDFDVRLNPHNDDEIGQLCASINNMAEELSNAEQVKNDFISSVSHELRTPLTAIRGWGETLLSDDDLDPETRRKGMQVIMGETERLSQMVEELLDFSRIQGGRMVLSRENVDRYKELISLSETACGDVPAYYKLEGTELVTEGFLTIEHLLEYCEEWMEDRLSFNRLKRKKDAAALLGVMLFEQATDK